MGIAQFKSFRFCKLLIIAINEETMFNIFKRKSSNSSDVLLANWTNYCNEIGLKSNQILGLAYFIATIPTVLASGDSSKAILKPLSKLVNYIGKVSSSGANIMHLYREFYFNAAAQDNSSAVFDFDGHQFSFRSPSGDCWQLAHIPFDDAPIDFFNDENNKYLEIAESTKGLIRRSRLTLMLIDRLGTILERDGINVPQSFELGHYHSNYLLKQPNGIHYSLSVELSNQPPHYIVAAIEGIRAPDSLEMKSDIWSFSKIFYSVINDEVKDVEFREWLWHFHNAIFYENKPGSLKIKDEWNFSDSMFAPRMIKAEIDLIDSFYELKPNIGRQQIGVGKKYDLWEDFYPLLDKKLLNEYDVDNSTLKFLNVGEFCNYLSYKFIAVVRTYFEHFK